MHSLKYFCIFVILLFILFQNKRLLIQTSLSLQHRDVCVLSLCGLTGNVCYLGLFSHSDSFAFAAVSSSSVRHDSDTANGDFITSGCSRSKYGENNFESSMICTVFIFVALVQLELK